MVLGHVGGARDGRGKSRVVDEDVDPAGRGIGIFDKAVDRVPLADVGGNGPALAPQRLDLGHGLLAALGVPAGDDDVGALAGEPLGHLETQAAAASGDEGNLAGKIEVVGHV